MESQEKTIFSKDLPPIWEENIILRESGENIRWNIVFVGKIPKRVDLKIHLVAPKSRAAVSLVCIGRERMNTDVNIAFLHNAPDTYGRVISKAALFDESRFILKGMLHVTERGVGADTYFLGKALLLSPAARGEIYPYLEIETNEVKASHGSSVGKLDERDMFYLGTRGIGHGDAQAILLGSFFRELGRLLPDEERSIYPRTRRPRVYPWMNGLRCGIPFHGQAHGA